MYYPGILLKFRRLHTTNNNKLFEVSNRNTSKRYELCSKLTISTPERRRWDESKKTRILDILHTAHFYLCSFPFGRCWSYSTWIYIDSFKAFLDSFSKYFSYLFPFRTSLPLSWNCFQPPESCSSFPIPLIYAKLMFVGFYSFMHSILSFNFYEGRYFKSNAVRKC